MPRPSEPPPLGQGHWCEVCGERRLSGSVGTGEHAFDGFLRLPVLCEGLEVDFHGRALTESSLKLLATLGAKPLNYVRAEQRR